LRISIATFFALAVPFLGGCPKDAPATTTGPQLRSDAGGDGDGDGDGDAQMECDDGPKRECDCGPGEDKGVQYCNPAFATYSDCDCDKSSANFKCKAGYYTGTFKGKWRPGALDLGNGWTTVKAEIEAKGKNGAPGLALTLVEKSDNTGEFPTYEVKNGCVYGAASAFGPDTHPFVGTLSGELDCETGQFNGIMDGKYDFFDLAGASIWKFSGPLVATFDEAQVKLDMGTWRMKEKQAKPTDNPYAGGEGTWDAVWQGTEAPDLPPECKAFIEAGGQDDAGVWDGGGVVLIP
jgi:hypothetical protein